MTAWQDQPPQSRRQARQNERGTTPDAQAGVAQLSPHSDNFEGFPRDGWESQADASAATPPPAGATPPEAGSTPPEGERSRARAARPGVRGRRAQSPFPQTPPAQPITVRSSPSADATVKSDATQSQTEQSPAAAQATPLQATPEPLHYVTQSRPQIPNYDGPSFRGGTLAPRADAARPEPELPPTEALEVQRPESGAYRVRDFRPESRRSAFSSTAPTSASLWTPPAVGSSADLDYQTQQGLTPTPVAASQPAAVEPAAVEPAIVEPPAAAVPPAQAPAEQHTLTRRELRAMRARGEKPAQIVEPTAEPSETTSVLPAAPTPLATPALAAAFDALTREEPAAATSTPAETVPFDATQAEWPSPISATTQTPATTQIPATDSWTIDARADVAATDAPVTSETASTGPSDIDFFAQLTGAEVVEPETEPDIEAQPEAQLNVEPETEIFDPLVATPRPAVQPTDFSALVADAAPAADAETVEPVPAEVESAVAEPWPFAGLIAEPDAALDTTGGVAAEPVLAPSEPEAVAPSVTEMPVPETPTNVEAGSPVPDAVHAVQPPVAAAPPPVNDGDAYSVPAGHWSRQASIDDDTQIHHTLSRNVGTTSGAVTANTLVVSSIPTANDLIMPLGTTGEILITGSIDLPRSLGSTGAHPARYDHSDVDALIDADDREDSHVDSAPVRAIRAVSTHTSTRGVIEAAKPTSASRLPLVLAVSAAVMAVGVVTLVVMGFMNHVFG
jgi:hypothetical protein